MFADVFFNQKRVNVSEHTVKMAPLPVILPISPYAYKTWYYVSWGWEHRLKVY